MGIPTFFVDREERLWLVTEGVAGFREEISWQVGSRAQYVDQIRILEEQVIPGGGEGVLIGELGQVGRETRGPSSRGLWRSSNPRLVPD
jgi:hypothetical protein